MRAHGTGSIYIRHRTACPRKRGCACARWIKVPRPGQAPLREPAGRTDRDAVKKLNERLGQLARGEVPDPGAERVTIAQLVGAVRDDYGLNGQDVAYLDRRAKHVTAAFGVRRAHTLGAAEVQAYKLARRKAGASPATVNRELALLKRAFNLGIEHGRIWRKPHITLLVEENVRNIALEGDALTAMLRALRPNEVAHDVVLLGYYLMWRRGEVLGIENKQVDARRRVLRMPPHRTKGGEQRVVALPLEGWAIIQKWHARRAGPWGISRHLFHRAGKQVRSIRRAFETARTRAGVSGARFHDLRRGGLRLYADAGASDKELMERGGWRTRHMIERYHVVTTRDLQRTAERVDQTGTHLGTGPGSPATADVEHGA